MIIHGAVVCMCGDTPASNFVAGFKEGVGFHFINVDVVWLLETQFPRMLVQLLHHLFVY